MSLGLFTLDMSYNSLDIHSEFKAASTMRNSQLCLSPSSHLNKNGRALRSCAVQFV